MLSLTIDQQAFTATDPSVEINGDQWTEIPDIEENNVVFTDGVGTISVELSNMIWDALRQRYSDRGENAIQPTAVSSLHQLFNGYTALEYSIKSGFSVTKVSFV